MNRKGRLVIAVLLVISFGGYYVINHTELLHKHGSEEKTQYYCPMHPQIVQDKPGSCPICGMTLVPMDRNKGAGDKKVTVIKKKKILYKSTMNQGEISDKAGKDSMGMEMVPFEVDENPDTGPAGLASIHVSRDNRALLGLKFEKVERRNLYREIRATTKIAADETRMFKVTTKVSGWIEELYANQTGMFIRKGDPLFRVYSPDLFGAQQEYLSSLKAADKYKTLKDQSMKDTFEDLSHSAREKLKLLDITDSQIKKLEESGKIDRSMVLYSPASGYIVEKMVVAGQKIMMNDSLMTIADMSVVWGEMDIYESDIPYVTKGLQAELTLPYWQDKIFRGRITFILPFLDKDTRTIKARLEIPNTGLLLKPQMFADARIRYGLGRSLAVPENAVMRSGKRDYVFKEGSDDQVIPVEIKIGPLSGDGYYQVFSGLKEGESVVTTANFLIDSESSLKAVFQSVTGSTSETISETISGKTSGKTPGSSTGPSEHQGHVR